MNLRKSAKEAHEAFGEGVEITFRGGEIFVIIDESKRLPYEIEVTADVIQQRLPGGALRLLKNRDSAV